MVAMRSKRELTDFLESGPDRELRLLTEVDCSGDVTQRELSRRVGIALGLTNVLLRSLAEKGYVRITQAGWKRWLYTLTPAGFSRKLRLTVAYIHRFLGHYQKVRQMVRDELAPLGLNEESRIAIYGTGEFAELVYLALKELGIDEVDVFSPRLPVGSKFLGIAVQEAGSLRPERYDRIVVAQLVDSDSTWVELGGLREAPEKLVTLFPAYIKVKRTADVL